MPLRHDFYRVLSLMATPRPVPRHRHRPSVVTLESRIVRDSSGGELTRASDSVLFRGFGIPEPMAKELVM